MNTVDSENPLIEISYRCSTPPSPATGHWSRGPTTVSGTKLQRSLWKARDEEMLCREHVEATCHRVSTSQEWPRMAWQNGGWWTSLCCRWRKQHAAFHATTGWSSAGMKLGNTLAQCHQRWLDEVYCHFMRCSWCFLWIYWMMIH